jgi:HD superfamily phosphohydrolase
MTETVRIVDPVHGYIAITPIERALLDSPSAQRLRYVGQSGLAHLVFPDLRTSRFVHSLGAMHLASRFLAASLENAVQADREAAEDAITEAVESVLGDLASARRAAEGLGQGALLCDRVASTGCKHAILLAEQSLRLAALFHDLGHLPFSHDFEYAVEQLASEPEHRRTRRATTISPSPP